MTNSLFFMSQTRLFYIFLSLVLISGLDVSFEAFRYLKYLIIPIVILLIAIKKPLIVEVHRAFILFLLFALLHIPFSDVEGIKDYIFILCYSAPFLFFNRINVSVEKIFIVTAVIFVLGILSNGINHFQFSLLDSSSSFENHSFSFVFGLFSVYFLLSKRWFWFAFSLLFSILVLKRISILAIFICFILSLIPKPILKKLLNWKLILILNISGLFVCFFITTETFNYFSMDLLGVSSSYLTMGRSVLYYEIFNHENWNIFNFLFGNGFGSSYKALESIAWEDKVHLHNDILKIMFENGFILLVSFLIVLYRNIPLKNRVFTVYLNVVLFTDNVFVYVFVMFFYMFLALEIYRNNSTS